MAPFLFSRNVQLDEAARLSPWRKVAIGTWRTAGDPSVYGILELDAEPALEYLDRQRTLNPGLKLTLTHFVGRAIAEVLKRHPDINCILRWGRLYPRKSVDVFFQVASDSNGKDLSGMSVREADKKSVARVARELQESVREIREQGDPAFKRMKGIMGLLPGFAIRWVLTITGFFMYTLNLWSPLLGTPQDPFGSVMITSIGSLGLDMAFAPLVPYSRVPLLIAVGAIRQTPVVKGGKVEVARRISLCVTLDHRLIDGVHAAAMARTLQDIFAHPEQELTPG